jgi:hypothetical protein
MREVGSSWLGSLVLAAVLGLLISPAKAARQLEKPAEPAPVAPPCGADYLNPRNEVWLGRVDKIEQVWVDVGNVQCNLCVCILYFQPASHQF